MGPYDTTTVRRKGESGLTMYCLAEMYCGVDEDLSDKILECFLKRNWEVTKVACRKYSLFVADVNELLSSSPGGKQEEATPCLLCLLHFSTGYVNALKTVCRVRLIVRTSMRNCFGVM